MPITSASRADGLEPHCLNAPIDTHNTLLQKRKLAIRGAAALPLFPENRENIRENPFFGASGRLSRQIWFSVAVTYGRFPARLNSEA